MRLVEAASETPFAPSATAAHEESNAVYTEQEVKFRLALEMDEMQQNEQEAADIAQAIQLSKADLLQEELVLLQLTRQARSAKVTDQLMNAPQLAHCRQLVADEGCQLQPNWAGGAWLLAPLSEPHLYALLEESPDARLQNHHVLLRSRDIRHLRSALAELPRRLRPNVKMESGLGLGKTSAEQGSSCGPISSSVSAAACAKALSFENTGSDVTESALDGLPIDPPAGDMATAWNEHLCLAEPWFIVERTFVSVVEPKAALKDSETLQSAPCGTSVSKQPLNPRRFV